MADEGPLTEQDYRDMKAKLAELDQADRHIEQAIRGGIDMSDMQKQSREHREQIKKLLQAYFPGR